MYAPGNGGQELQEVRTIQISDQQPKQDKKPPKEEDVDVDDFAP